MGCLRLVDHHLVQLDRRVHPPDVGLVPKRNEEVPVRNGIAEAKPDSLTLRRGKTVESRVELDTVPEKTPSPPVYPGENIRLKHRRDRVWRSAADAERRDSDEKDQKTSIVPTASLKAVSSLSPPPPQQEQQPEAKRHSGQGKDLLSTGEI